MTEPTTAAGRALLGDATIYGPNADEVRQVILAIEDEARQQDAFRQVAAYFGDGPLIVESGVITRLEQRPLDVERLARAIWRASNGDPEVAFDGRAAHRAERIDAEYEKLPVDPSGHPQSLATRPAPAKPPAAS